MPTGAGEADRLGGLDAAKALAIVGVVAIHAAPTEPSAYLRVFVAGVAQLAVPTFLVVTGFLAGWNRSERSRFAGYFRRFLRLHLIYGLFYWAIAIARTGQLEVGPKAVLLHFGEAAYPGQFYFVILVQLFFAAAFVLPTGFWRSPVWLSVSALVAILGILLVPEVRALPAQGGIHALVLAVAGSGSALWLWLYYFALGGFLADRARAGHLPAALGDRRLGWLLIAAGVSAAAAGVPVWGGPFAGGYLRPPVLVGATLVAIAIPGFAAARPPRLLQRLGAASFGVFVFNPALIIALRAVFGPTRGPFDSWLLVAAVVLVAVPLTEQLRRRVPALVP